MEKYIRTSENQDLNDFFATRNTGLHSQQQRIVSLPKNMPFLRELLYR